MNIHFIHICPKMKSTCSNFPRIATVGFKHNTVILGQAWQPRSCHNIDVHMWTKLLIVSKVICKIPTPIALTLHTLSLTTLFLITVVLCISLGSQSIGRYALIAFQMWPIILEGRVRYWKWVEIVLVDCIMTVWLCLHNSLRRFIHPSNAFQRDELLYLTSHWKKVAHGAMTILVTIDNLTTTMIWLSKILKVILTRIPPTRKTKQNKTVG